MTDRMTAAVRRALRSIGNLLTRAVVARVGDRSKTQTLDLDLLADERADDVQHFQPHGLLSVPLPGAHSLALFLGGNRSNPVAIMAGDDRYRARNNTPGDVGLYHHLDDPTASAESATHRLVLTERNGERVALLRCDRLEIRADEIAFRAGGTSVVMTDDGIVMTTPDFEAVQP